MYIDIYILINVGMYTPKLDINILNIKISMYLIYLHLSNYIDI